MARDVLTHFADELRDARFDVAVQRFDDIRDRLSVDRLVVSVGAGPDHRVGLRIVELQLERKAGGESGGLDFVERVELAPDYVIAAETAADARHGAVITGGTQRLDDDVLKHAGGRLGPALVFVRAVLHRAGAIDEAIFAVKVRCADAGDQNWRGGLRGGGNGGRRSGIERVILHRARAAAAGDGCTNQNDERGLPDTTRQHCAFLPVPVLLRRRLTRYARGKPGCANQGVRPRLNRLGELVHVVGNVLQVVENLIEIFRVRSE